MIDIESDTSRNQKSYLDEEQTRGKEENGTSWNSIDGYSSSFLCILLLSVRAHMHAHFSCLSVPSPH